MTEWMSKRQAILERLSDLQWHSWRELNAVGGVRYGARVLELKRQGHIIDTKASPTGGRYYKLAPYVNPPSQKQVRVYLRPEDVEALITGIVSDDVVEACKMALVRFRSNP